MAKTINILGDTPKQQWLNAIGIYELCIRENARNVRDELMIHCEFGSGAYECGIDEPYGECVECSKCHSLDVVMEQGKNFADEMRRLVEGVFDE